MTARGLVSVWMLCGALVAGAAMAGDPLPESAAGSVRSFVFFSATRPVLIRLHFRIGSEPLDARWEAFVHDVFTSLDTDQSGSLTREEAERAPPAGIFAAAVDNSAAPVFGQLDKDRDGTVSEEELRRYYRDNGGAPLQLQVNAGPTAAEAQLNADQAVAGDALNAALIKALDADGDGQLSSEELTVAPEQLLKLDSDGDGVIVPGEVAMDEPTETSTASASGPVFRELKPDDSSADLARQILSRYGKSEPSSGGKLARQNSRLEETLFNELDADKDDVLSPEELARFVERTPDAEFAVRLGDRGKETSNTDIQDVAGHPSGLAAHLRRHNDALFLELGTTTLQWRVAGEKAVDRGAANTAETYKLQFMSADTDSNGYLDAKEARQSAFFRPLFKRLDPDSDGMVFEKDVTAYLDRVAGIRDKAMAARAVLTVSDNGRGLFDQLDANHDRRIGPRELRGAAGLVARLDANRDGRISKDEIPRSYLAVMGLGSLPGSGRVFALSTQPQTGLTPTNIPSSPLWFLKMDRNRDGDVSRAEFLGTDEQFTTIDTDGDGLIGRNEAQRANDQQ